MDESFCSAKCPNCKQSLLEAGLTSIRFLTSAYCPFCGATVRWARIPLFLFFIGMFSIALGWFSLAFEEPLFFPTPLWASVAVGGGIALFFLAVIFLRIVQTGSSTGESYSHARAYYPYVG